MTAAEQERDAAIDAVEAAADQEWYETALVAVLGLAIRMPHFTTDDLIEAMADTDPPREPRVLGAVMRAAQREGWAHPSDRYGSSSRRQSHARPKRIWLSTLN